MHNKTNTSKTIKQFLKPILIWLFVVVSLFWIVTLFLEYYARVGEEVIVPNVTSMPLKDALDSLSKYSLTYRIQDTQKTVMLPTGYVMFQYPSSQTLTKKGRTVSLVLASFNYQNNVLPKVLGDNLRTASFKLQELQINIKDTVWVDSLPLGEVVKICLKDKEVKDGAVLGSLDSITLYVGMKRQDMVEVPNLLGVSEVEARIILQSRGLALGTVYRSELDLGFTLEQYPHAEDSLGNKIRVPRATEVNIWIE